jgi:signal transduction histidine kinase
MKNGITANCQWGGSFALILIVTITLAALPFIVRITEPTAWLAFNEARISIDRKPSREIRLPYSWPQGLPETTASDYVIDFMVDSLPSLPQSLFIPIVRQHLAIKLNGTILDHQKTTPWANLSRGYIKLLDIPSGILVRGQNRMVLSLTRNNGIVPGYLSQIYIGNRDTIVTNRWLMKLLSEQSRTITVALHLFIVAGLLTVWGARPRDAIFRWLAIIGITSLVVVIVEFRPLPAIIDIARPWLVMVLSSFGLMMIGLAMAISRMPRPRWLFWLIVGIPTTLVLLYATGVLPLPATVLPSVAVAIGGHVIAGAILIRTFTRQREWVYGFLAIPFFLTAWFGLRDVAVVFDLIPGGFLLSTFVRPATYLSVLVLLMYRLASSLNRLDQANDVLRTRLAAQEAELSALHAKEKVLVGQTVREQERQRLMRDLHDGLSGYLVSIIAISEKHGCDLGIERMARDALSVLRILQEAVTNALKHGPARTIYIEGATGTAGNALISVTSDRSFIMSSGSGNGLSNMQLRAQKLGGYISTTKSEDEYELVLSLPRFLSEN